MGRSTAHRPSNLKEEAAHEPPPFLSTVEFQVTTLTRSLNLLLGSSASLHCGFSMAPGLDLISVEWRLQHKGSGQLVYSWMTGQGQAKRQGATLKPEELLMAGDASLTLPSLSLTDEGTYICQITTSQFQAQQIIQLNIQGEARAQLSWIEGTSLLGVFSRLGSKHKGNFLRGRLLTTTYCCLQSIRTDGIR